MEQEIQHQQPLILAQSILSALPEGEIDKLFDKRIDQRKRAVDTILSRLAKQDEESQGDTLQSIPLAMLMDGRYMEAASFITYTIERGGYFDINIIIEVIQNLGTSMLLCMDEGDGTAEYVLREALYGFCEYVLTLDWYNENPIIYITLGSIYEGERKTEIAIRAYNEAIKLGSTDAYICIASLYEKLGRYAESADTLKQAYDKTKDNRFLQGYISALSKSGNRKEAYEYYLKLIKKVTRPMLQETRDLNSIILPTSGLPPFIVFTEEVHSDTDLDDFMDLIVGYHTEATYFPNIYLRNIAEKAAIYISNEIEGINKTLRELMSVSGSDWNDEQIVIHRELVKRRLYLMQTHVIILQSDLYLDAYLHDMRELSLSESPEGHTILREFFDKYFNPYTQAAYDHVTDGGGGDIEKMEVLERVKIHLVHINALFSQGTFFETIRDDIEPFIDACLDQTNAGTDSSIEDSEIEFHYSQRVSTSSDSTQTVYSYEGDIEMIKLQKEEKNYEALNAATMDMYEEFVRFLDGQYGTFYRRSVQQLVRDRAALPASAMGDLQSALIRHNGDKERAFREVIYNMPALVENPYVALFFFIEKVLLGDDWLEEGQTIDQWIDKYGFNQIGLSDAVLWVCILNENGYPDEAAEFIIKVPGILGAPQALHIIMESIGFMDDGDNDADDATLECAISGSTDAEGDEKENNRQGDTGYNESSRVQEFIKALNKKCSEEYGIDDFFEYFDGFMQNVIEDEHATDIEIGYTLLASGNMRCIQGQSENMAIREFVTAGEYGIAYGYINAADMLQDMDKHSDALEYLLIAHKQAPSIITIRRLLNLYMETGNLEEAWRLIDSSVRDGYDIVGYISACYLCEGKTKEALRRFCRILTSQGDIAFAFPDWYEKEVARIIKIEIDTPMTSLGDFEINILGSYVFADRMSIDPNDYVNHAQSIIKLLETHPLEDACTIISKTIPLLTGAIDLPASNSVIESSLIYLQLHLERIHAIILNLYKSELLKNSGITDEDALKMLKLLNNFMFSAIFIVGFFPNSQKYSTTWQRALNFYHTDEYRPSPDQYIHLMPNTIQ